jgi:hypothetical protein
MTASSRCPAGGLLALLIGLASCGDTYFLGNLPPDPIDASNDGTPTFGCDGCAPPHPYDPCAGKACGDPCMPCPSTDPNCVGPVDVFLCDSNGACTGRLPVSCDGGAAYDPCAGKACGETCTLCAPDDLTCREPSSAKTCGGDAGCSSCKAM